MSFIPECSIIISAFCILDLISFRYLSVFSVACVLLVCGWGHLLEKCGWRTERKIKTTTWGITQNINVIRFVSMCLSINKDIEIN